ncbi:hypothetical protein CRYUN_Cryun17cG0106400 [Craigia yunnanensis]
MENSEKKTEKSEGEIENLGTSDGQVRDGIDRNNEEEREEHYKGDDASSEVVHDTQNVAVENETSGLENSNESEQLENKD